jgi:uncharacterized protein (TIGR02611 family)
MPGSRETADEAPPDADPGAPGDVATHTVEPHEDRWRWRRRIRANPVQHRVYRAVVGLVGLLLIVLGLVTGPIPGPGGIPLVLLGIAVWASEFAWAHRLMQVFKAQLHRYQTWSRWQQAGFWVVFLSFCGLCGYAFMLVLGIPAWVPATGDALLEQLPGL